jgi:tetratricopeptide (TPR) repeat protein
MASSKDIPTPRPAADVENQAVDEQNIRITLYAGPFLASMSSRSEIEIGVSHIESACSAAATTDALVRSSALGYISCVVPEREHRIGNSLGTLFLSVLFCLYGCGSGAGTMTRTSEAVVDTLPQWKQADTVVLSKDQREELAVRHYIAGSAHEEAGEYDDAIGEFELALSYDPSPVIHCALSRNSVETQRFVEAANHGLAAVRLAPEDIHTHEQLADVYIALGRYDSAVEQYEIMFRLDSTNEQTRFMLARLYHADRPERALELYESILHGDGDDDDVLLNIAELDIDLGRYARAAVILESLRRFDADNDYILTLLIDAYNEDGKRKNALSVGEDLMQRFPEQQRYAARLAGLYAENDRWPDARGILHALLAEDSLDAETAADIGELYYQRAIADSTLIPEADTAFAVLLRRAPEDWHPRWYAGALAFNTGRMSEAASNFSAVLEQDPGNTEALDVLARTFLRMDDPASAILPLQTLADRNLADAETYSSLGYAYHLLRQDSLAIAALSRALGMEPDRVDALSTLALIHDDNGRTDRSDSLYQAALRTYENPSQQKDDAYYLLFNNYSYSLAQRGLDLERALGMSRESVQFDNSNSSYLDTFGWILFRHGDLDSAKQYISRAIAASTADPSPVFFEHLGDILIASGNREAAIAAWKQSLALDPGNATLVQKIREVTP